MAIVTIDDTNLTNIANAIREKNGSTDTYKPSEMANAINNITTNEDLTNEFNDYETYLNNQDITIENIIRALEGKTAGGGTDTSEIEEAFIKRTFTEYSNDTITSIGNSAFRTCNQLTKINFPNSTNTGDYAFYDCSKLTDLNFPIAKNISTQCFRGCSSLVEVTFPEATHVEAYAFYGDKALTKVRLPKVKSFGVSALNGCTGLTTLIIEQTDAICTLAGNVFANSSVASGTGYVYVPDNLVDTYKSYTNWSAYASQIKPLSELEE